MTARAPLPLVEFIIGDADAATGWPGSVKIPVAYIAQFPRDRDGTCAFCHGDPCAEFSPPDSQIAQYFARGRARAAQYENPLLRQGAMPQTCPCCDGRPT